MLAFLRRLFAKESDSSPGKKDAPLYIVGARNARTHEKPASKRTAKPAAPSSEEPFDPYNTGAFNRSKSWERISKQRDR